MEPKTEREYLIKLDTNVTTLTAAIEKLTAVVEKLQDVEIKALEDRIGKLEKSYNEWNGVYKALILASIILSIWAMFK